MSPINNVAPLRIEVIVRKTLCLCLVSYAVLSLSVSAAAVLPQSGFMTSLRKRALDSLDGDDFSMRKRALDYMDGDGFGFKKRALDNLEGDDFGGLSKRGAYMSANANRMVRWPPVAIPSAFGKRALDNLEGEGFDGFEKRALDSLEGEGFSGFNKKRALDNLEGAGFDGFKKRALDNLEGEGFDGFEKRALDILEGDDFGDFEKKKRTVKGGPRSAVGLTNPKSKQQQHTQQHKQHVGRPKLLLAAVGSRDETRLRRALDDLNRRRADALTRHVADDHLNRVLKRSLDMLEGNDFDNF